MSTLMHHRPARAWAFALIAGVTAHPALAAAPPLLVERLHVSLGVERVALPDGERMGLVGASLLFDAGAGWWSGPAVYGAATGQRGGFYVGGAELQRRWALGPATELAAGLFAGGGGGAGAPVGGGLMLRPALTLWQHVGPVQAGLGWSSLRFPSGTINSAQWSLLLGWSHDFLHAAPGARLPQGRTGLGFDRMALTLGRYQLTGAAGTGRSIGLAGMRAERDLTRSGLVGGVEAAAAASGDAAGYMEILGDLGWHLAPLPHTLPSLQVGVRAALGVGGGGAMPTGGGLFGKLTATLSARPLPGWTLGLDLGRAQGHPLRARSAQLWLATDLEPAAAASPDSGAAAERTGIRTEWGATLQRHVRVPRSDGSSPALDTIGIELNRYLSRHVYLSGQVHSAYAGGAGAYSIGLIGLGLASSDDAPWRAGAELTAGAAGGGGVVSNGGAVAQARGWVGWSPVPEQALRLGVARMRSHGSGRSTPIAALSWSRRFLLGGR